HFMTACRSVFDLLGLLPGNEDAWLSAINPADLPAAIVRSLVDAHRHLVAHAKTLSSVDAFWASYPFSIVIVDGSPGARLGEIQAVLLSPLHPARLAWAFSVAKLAESQEVDAVLLG